MTDIKHGDFAGLRQYINSLNTDSVLIVIDGNVYQRYRTAIDIGQIDSSKKIIVWKTPEGEATKNISEYENCLEFFLEKGVHRKSHLVAIGGGALSDFAGFVASTLLRGVKWSVVPTTLLSMVDASIGGKVAINSKSGKNLIGAFHLPEAVYFNPAFLDTLPLQEINSGKGEIFKYAILDKKLNELVVSKADQFEIIKACAEYKKQLTEKDFQESGLRKILNLGHTFGHALEYIYRIPHGEAVMWGILIIDEIFQGGNLKDDIKKIFSSLDWNLEHSPWLNKTFPVGQIMEYLYKDKKLISNADIDMVLAKQIGNPEIVTMSMNDVENKLGEVADELRKLTL